MGVVATTRLRRPALAGPIVIAALLVPASGAPNDPAVVLHEYFVYPAGDVDEPAPGLPPLPAPGASDPTLDIPEPAARYGASGPELGEGGWESPVRNGPFSPSEPALLDADTGPEGQLRYVEIFDPSVAPWKRSVARDRVLRESGSYGLVVGNAELRPYAVDPAVAPDTSAFTGRLTVTFRAGYPMPLPSVAPGMSIHGIRTEPPVQVQFATDGADNHFVLADWDGPVTLTFEASAPRFYFDGTPPGDDTPVRIQDADPDVSDVLAAIGVSEGMRSDAALRALVDWFAGFEAAELPDTDAADLYREISLARRGVCRHRAISFTITARAIGINARYVHNEAHAFVEVFHEGAGWRRYDLGGEAEGLDVVNDTPRDEQRAPSADAAPYPEREVAQQSELPPARPDDQGGGANTDGAQDAASLDAQARSVPGVPTDGTSRPRTFGELPQPAGDAARLPGQVVRLATRIAWSDVPAAVFAGEQLIVAGTLEDADGGPVMDAEIEIWLGPADASRLEAPVQSLGRIRTGRDGTFAGPVSLPAETPVGDWGLFAVYAGDLALEPTRSP